MDSHTITVRTRRPRLVMVSFRSSPEELAIMKEKAALSGQTFSMWARSRLLFSSPSVAIIDRTELEQSVTRYTNALDNHFSDVPPTHDPFSDPPPEPPQCPT